MKTAHKGIIEIINCDNQACINMHFTNAICMQQPFFSQGLLNTAPRPLHVRSTSRNSLA